MFSLPKDIPFQTFSHCYISLTRKTQEKKSIQQLFTMVQYFKTLFYLLERFSFSFFFNHETVPVYHAFHFQLDLHLLFNHTLRDKSGIKLRSVTN